MSLPLDPIRATTPEVMMSSFRGRFWVAVLIPLAGITACDSSTTATDSNMAIAAVATGVATDAPITGTWTGVVTTASDLNQASFGRDPAEWVGQAVNGTFAVHLGTPGIGDHDPTPTGWDLYPFPGPGPFVEFVTLTAAIGDYSFHTSSGEYHTIFFGDVVKIDDSSAHPWFRPQDSYVGAGPGGTGRSVIGFDAMFAVGGVTFDGTSLAIDASRMTFGQGVIDDLLVQGSVTIRQGSIVFQLTDLKVSPIGALEQPINRLRGSGAMTARQATSLRHHVNLVEKHWRAGRFDPACGQLSPLVHLPYAWVQSGSLSDGSAWQLAEGVRYARMQLGCKELWI